MDFEKLTVYHRAKEFNRKINEDVLSLQSINRIIKDQLRRASLSIVLNIAEGCSRFSKADRKNFFIISRGSAFESVAILDVLSPGIIENELLSALKSLAEEISKMLFVMIRNLMK
jgi:four helix bundle protein